MGTPVREGGVSNPARTAADPVPHPDGDAPARASVTAPDGTFEAFYATEAAAVHRAVAATLPDPSRAADAVDEAMARACASWSRVGAYDAPAGWVYRVAMNWATSRWRKLRREASLPDDLGGRSLAAGPEAASTVGTPAIEALRRLPLDQRRVIACRVLLDLDTATTARALGIAEGTVKSRLARGLAALRDDLEER